MRSLIFTTIHLELGCACARFSVCIVATHLVVRCQFFVVVYVCIL